MQPCGNIGWFPQGLIRFCHTLFQATSLPMQESEPENVLHWQSGCRPPKQYAAQWQGSLQQQGRNGLAVAEFPGTEWHSVSVQTIIPEPKGVDGSPHACYLPEIVCSDVARVSAIARPERTSHCRVPETKLHSISDKPITKHSRPFRGEGVLPWSAPAGSTANIPVVNEIYRRSVCHCA